MQHAVGSYVAMWRELFLRILEAGLEAVSHRVTSQGLTVLRDLMLSDASFDSIAATRRFRGTAGILMSRMDPVEHGSVHPIPTPNSFGATGTCKHPAFPVSPVTRGSDRSSIGPAEPEGSRAFFCNHGERGHMQRMMHCTNCTMVSCELALKHSNSAAFPSNGLLPTCFFPAFPGLQVFCAMEFQAQLLSAMPGFLCAVQ